MPFLSCMQACKRSVLVLETFSFSTEPHLNSMAAPKPWTYHFVQPNIYQTVFSSSHWKGKFPAMSHYRRACFVAPWRFRYEIEIQFCASMFLVKLARDLTRPHPKWWWKVREFPIFQGNPCWWDIIVWPESCNCCKLLGVHWYFFEASLIKLLHTIIAEIQLVGV